MPQKRRGIAQALARAVPFTSQKYLFVLVKKHCESAIFLRDENPAPLWNVVVMIIGWPCCPNRKYLPEYWLISVDRHRSRVCHANSGSQVSRRPPGQRQIREWLVQSGGRARPKSNLRRRVAADAAGYPSVSSSCIEKLFFSGTIHRDVAERHKNCLPLAQSGVCVRTKHRDTRK